MLSQSDNELICRVGPGTPMGELMRRHWIPAVASRDLKADGELVRPMSLGGKPYRVAETRFRTNDDRESLQNGHKAARYGNSVGILER